MKLNDEVENRKKELAQERRRNPQKIENLDEIAFAVLNDKPAVRPRDEIEFMVDVYKSTPLDAIKEEYKNLDNAPELQEGEQAPQLSAKLEGLYKDKQAYEEEYVKLLSAFQEAHHSGSNKNELEHLQAAIRSFGVLIGDIDEEIKRELERNTPIFAQTSTSGTVYEENNDENVRSERKASLGSDSELDFELEDLGGKGKEKIYNSDTIKNTLFGSSNSDAEQEEPTHEKAPDSPKPDRKQR